MSSHLQTALERYWNSTAAGQEYVADSAYNADLIIRGDYHVFDRPTAAPDACAGFTFGPTNGTFTEARAMLAVANEDIMLTVGPWQYRTCLQLAPKAQRGLRVILPPSSSFELTRPYNTVLQVGPLYFPILPIGHLDKHAVYPVVNKITLSEQVETLKEAMLSLEGLGSVAPVLQRGTLQTHWSFWGLPNVFDLAGICDTCRSGIAVKPGAVQVAKDLHTFLDTMTVDVPVPAPFALFYADPPDRLSNCVILSVQQPDGSFGVRVHDLRRTGARHALEMTVKKYTDINIEDDEFENHGLRLAMSRAVGAPWAGPLVPVEIQTMGMMRWLGQAMWSTARALLRGA